MAISPMREIRVRSWTELHDHLFADSWDHALHRHRSSFAFRGVCDASLSLACGLSRLGPRSAELEEPLLRTFRKYARRMVGVDDSIWSWMAVAQHHGLPTRLLDWTFSPYVALHFMTENAERFDRDGTVWMIDYVKVKHELPDRLRTILDEEEASVFTAEMIGRAVTSLRELDALDGEFLVFLEPASLDDRTVNQYALFSLMPRADCGSLERWLGAKRDLARKIVVPAALKWEVRDKLDQANVTERVLYPGLDGLTRWLARYYTPREGPPRER
jgi:hypothetical protein